MPEVAIIPMWSAWHRTVNSLVHKALPYTQDLTNDTSAMQMYEC